MARTRAAVLAGALRGVERYGTKRTTMGEVATLGGVAKATVYNHFRAKNDVYAALVESEVRSLGQECVERASSSADRDPLAAALEHAATRLSDSRALRRLTTEEPQVAAQLTTSAATPAWDAARDAVVAVLEAAGRDSDPAAVDVVLRWVVSHVTSPGGRDVTARGAGVLARALPPSDGQPVPAGTAAERGTPPAADLADVVAAPEPVQERASDAGEQPAPVPSGLGWPG
jgi:AcrR family transcriptional regulator